MGRWAGGASGFVSGPVCVVCLLLATLLLGAQWAHAASGPASSGDASERAAQARALLDTPQAATLLDLLAIRPCASG